MAKSGHPARAVILLPPGIVAHDATPVVRRWLAKGRVRRATPREEPLAPLLRALGRPAVEEGLAALRKWGQTGQRPAGWLCAADPVYLEARLDHLCLFALDDLAAEDFSALITRLEAHLSPDRDGTISCFGTSGYLARGTPIATATLSSRAAHGERPERFLPIGPGAAVHDRLQTELQMCLHDIEVNRRREESGRAPVNALWFWGGGTAVPVQGGPLLRLFSDDPVIDGYWRSAGSEPAAWPGRFAECVGAAGAGFVAVPAWRREHGGYLEELRALATGGDLDALTLLFHDGLRIDLERRHRLRFWRLDLPSREEA